MRISVQNSLLVGQTTTFLQVQLGVDTIAILYFALTSSKNASTTKVKIFFLNGFTILNKHRIFLAGRLNKPFVEILLNFQTRRDLLSLCINYILQS